MSEESLVRRHHHPVREVCAHLDLRKLLAVKKGGPEVKRNFVCQCPKDSEVKTTSYAVTTGGANNAQRSFLLSRATQFSYMI